MKIEGKMFVIAILAMGLISGLTASMLTDGHTAEAKSKQKAKAKNHCKIKNKNSHHSSDNSDSNQQVCVSAAVNLKNVDVDLSGLFD